MKLILGHFFLSVIRQEENFTLGDDKIILSHYGQAFFTLFSQHSTDFSRLNSFILCAVCEAGVSAGTCGWLSLSSSPVVHMELCLLCRHNGWTWAHARSPGVFGFCGGQF